MRPARASTETVARNPLEEAEALFNRRRWAELIGLLEPMSSVYRENAKFSVLLGSAYLHKEDIGGAFSCFRRAQSLDYKDNDAATGLAAVYIKRGDSDKAVQLYVEMLERQPRDKRALMGLKYVRKATGNDAQSMPEKLLRKLYPQAHRRLAPFIVLFLSLALIAGSIVLFPYIVDLIRAARPARSGVSEVVLSQDELASPVSSDGGFAYVLTQKEAVDTFNKAKRLFSDYRDEAALVELNRLLLSNATRQVKAKATSLAHYVREPSFLTLPDRFVYKEVSFEPLLYEGVGVVWKGLPANVETGPTSTTFDLLVGYQDKQRLEGIVQVRAGFEIKITPDRPVEVLARVKNLESGSFYLACLAIHEE